LENGTLENYKGGSTGGVPIIFFSKDGNSTMILSPLSQFTVFLMFVTHFVGGLSGSTHIS
jgi:hypothetical protein